MSGSNSERMTSPKTANFKTASTNKKEEPVAIISDDDNNKFEKLKNEDTTSEHIPFDTSFESTIRPKHFDDYVGQSSLKSTLKISIEAAKKRELPLDHILFYGPPGLGKTTLASVIATEMNANI